MSYEERIRRERAGMSRSFAKLADFLLDSYIEASFMTASELAHALNLDAATVVRFAQSLGYSGFPQLQREVRQRVKTNLLIRPGEAAVRNSLPGIAAGALHEIARDLEQTRLSLNTQALAALVERIGQSSCIYLLVDEDSRALVPGLRALLELGGFSVHTIQPAAADLARLVHQATSQDLLLAVDVSGKTSILANTLSEAKQRGCPTAALVGAASLPTARSADIILAAQSHQAGMSSLVLVNILIHVLSEALRWQYQERFRQTEQALAPLRQRIQEGS